MPDSGIREVTEPIRLALVDDRMQFTIVSGTRVRTYSISFHKCRNACMAATALLNKRDGEDRIAQFRRTR